MAEKCDCPTPPEGAEQKPYEAPKLTRYGTVTEMTQALSDAVPGSSHLGPTL